jgi:putative membrane protein
LQCLLANNPWGIAKHGLDSGWLFSDGTAPRNFGEALVFLGIGMLVVGIGYHVAFMVGLRKERERLKADGLIHAESKFPVSLTLMVAIVLLAIGVLAIVSMVYDVGPFR